MYVSEVNDIIVSTLPHTRLWNAIVDRFTSVYLRWPLADYGLKPGYGESVVVGEVASGILFLIAAIPLLISRIATFESTLLREEPTSIGSSIISEWLRWDLIADRHRRSPSRAARC